MSLNDLKPSLNILIPQVALITPLRDGMNLVAKEFVACQGDDDPGVLILSPFAGAGGIMQEALQVRTFKF